MIASPVFLAFDPDGTSDCEVREVFADDIARTLWLAIRPGHIVDQHFNKDCLIAAAGIRRNQIWNAIKLYHVINGMGKYGDGLGDFMTRSFCEELLPYIRGEKRLEYVVKERWERERLELVGRHSE